MHNIADIAFVGSNAVNDFIVDDEAANKLEVVGHLSAGDKVEHGSFTAAGGAEDGGEGVGVPRRSHHTPHHTSAAM